MNATFMILKCKLNPRSKKLTLTYKQAILLSHDLNATSTKHHTMF